MPLKKLAVIPARGGSKRIPRKNINLFCGKPIISYSIKKCIESGVFDEVIVSTDDDEIADVSLKYGASVPFVRPSDISGDYTGTNEVVSHAIKAMALNDNSYDYVCCVYATAPFLRGEYLLQGYDELVNSNADFSFSVTSYGFPLQRALEISNNRVNPVNPDLINVRSQDLVQYFHDAGQFYWGKPSSFIDGLDIFSADSLAILIPNYLVQDIDTIEDWKRAEMMYAYIKQEEK